MSGPKADGGGAPSAGLVRDRPLRRAIFIHYGAKREWDAEASFAGAV